MPHNDNLENKLKCKCAICIWHSPETGDKKDSSVTCVGITKSLFFWENKGSFVLPYSFCQNSLQMDEI